jgi:uncharacterized membrane protein
MIEISYYYLFIILTFLIAISFLVDYYLLKRIKRLDIKYEKLSGKDKETRNYVSELYAYLKQYRG